MSRESIAERREKVRLREKLEKKDMSKYLEKAKARHERSIKLIEKDIEFFLEHRLNVGDHAFHKEYGNCMILDIRIADPRRSIDMPIEWIADIAALTGTYEVVYSELMEPSAATKVLFDEKG